MPTFSPLVGAELRLLAHGSMTIEQGPTFEHGLLADAGPLTLAGTSLAPQEMGCLGVGETTATITN